MSLLLDLAIRSSIILAIGLLLDARLRNRSAALRHYVLAATVFAAAAVVPFSMALPAWEVSLPAPVTRSAEPAAEAPAAVTVTSTLGSSASWISSRRMRPMLPSDSQR